ncbi:MAG: glycosyltransferase family 4 protein [Bryobacterales bacterium]|nr:glycosyltransferase family 4 protein [Bryobacterales bacterium]
MNILVVSNVFPPGFVGGFELGALEVATGLADGGHKVTVLSGDYFLDETEESSPIEVRRILNCAPMSHELGDQAARHIQGTYFDFHNIRRMANSIRSLQIDLVLLFNIQGLGALSILRFLSATRMPTIAYLMDNPLHGLDRNSIASQRYESVFGASILGDNIRYIAMSRNVMQQFSESLGQPRSAHLFVPGWIHVEQYGTGAISPRRDLPVRFVFCSRIAPHKGIDLVLDAAEALVGQGVRNFSVDYFGQGQVAQLIQSIRARGLDRYVSYRGSKPKTEMVRTFEDYDALLFPTWEREPFGFVVSEAAAAGCVPIMTARIGASEWLIHEVDCLKIGRTSVALKNAMHHLIALDAEARSEFRRAARRSARQYLSFARWMPVIESECCSAGLLPAGAARAATVGVQAAFQYLGSLWREAGRDDQVD